MATGSPAGVVTRSSSRCIPVSSCSSTTMAKMLVPADTLPVRGATELVATIPVPASPSGGQSGMPGRSRPVGSSSVAPASVSSPAVRPATAIRGSRAGGGSPRRGGLAGGRAGAGERGQRGGGGQPPPGRGGRGVDRARRGGGVPAGVAVDREHAAGVADAEDLLAGEPPVHVAGQGG